MSDLLLLLLTLLLAITQLLDWYSTRTIINRGGYEQNKLMAVLFNEFGMDVVLGIKTVAVTLLGYIAGTENIWLLVGVVAWYVVVMIHNWRSLP